MIIWKKNCAADGDLHEYTFSVMKIYCPLMIDSMCSPSMSYVIVEMATVMRQYSNGLLVFVLPKILEPLRGQLGVPCGVLDVAMAQPLLNGSCVVPIVGQLKAASVAQHVRMDREGELGRCADARQLLAEAGRGHRRQALGGEDVGARRHLLVLEATQRSQLAATQDVRRRATLLEAADVHEALLEVDHVPAQTDQLGDAQAVPVGDEDHGAVVMGAAAEPFAAGLTQALHLLAGRELARPQLGVGAPWRRKC